MQRNRPEEVYYNGVFIFMRYLLLIFLFLTTLSYGQERRIIVLTDPNVDIRKETDDAMSGLY